MSIALFRLVGKDCLVIKRRGLPSIVKGKPVAATPTNVHIKANIQPAGYAELIQLSEADRSKELIMLMTQSELREMREGAWEADEFEWDGYVWEVLKVRSFKMRVRNHYQAICARKQLVK